MSISPAMAIVVFPMKWAKRFIDARKPIGLGRWTALIFAAFTLTPSYIFRGNVARVYGVTHQNLSIWARFLT